MLHEVNIVKYRKSDFLTAASSSMDVDLDFSDPEGRLFANTLIQALPECHITGVLHFDGRNRVSSDLHCEGVMTVIDSITGDELDVDFEAESEKTYSFDGADTLEEAVLVKNDTIDLTDEAVEAIVYEAPMSITRLAREDYPSGEGWSLVSDQDPVDEKKEEDPRWAKLKDFHFEDN